MLHIYKRLLTFLLLASFYLGTVFCYGAALVDVKKPGLPLANVYRSDIDITAYWVSEKLDGVRAYWDGESLRSKQGYIYRAPDWFIADFPRRPLDGELWMGRDTFDELSGAVRESKPDDRRWKKIKYMVFDLPDSNAVFDRRLEALEHIVSEIRSPWVSLVKQYKVVSHEALVAGMDRVVALGGEGLMLHKGSSRYIASRSDDLLKLKPYRDAEAIVIEYLPGKGKYEGVMGAMLVETIPGAVGKPKRFRLGVGFSDKERSQPPPIGAMITYKYFGLTKNGLPRFASFLRERRLP